MPIDSMMLDPMISPYKNMIADVEGRGLANEHVDALKAAYARLEALGQEHSDIGAFTGACMQEDLYTQLSNHYASALSAGASSAAGPEDYDDSALLKQSVDALRNSISELKRAQEGAVTEAADSAVEVEALDITGDIIPAIEALVALGEQEGMTLPRFLRLQIEQGLDKAMEGAVSTRKGLDYELGWAEASAVSPYHIEAAKEKLQIFDTLAAKQKFGVPNWRELQWANQDLEYKYVRDQAIFSDVTSRWESILDDLSTWALAHCSFAEQVEPWKLLDLPKRRPAIERDKATLPGIIKQKERLLEKYHGVSFAGIFEHPTFKWAVEQNFISYAREYVDFLRDTVYPACIPLESPPQEMIAQKEALHQGNREVNPNVHVPAERVKTFYDSKFGEGRYETRFGPVARVASNAAPW